MFTLVLQLVVEEILRTFRENRVDVPEVMCNKGPKGVLKLHKSSDLQRIITKLISSFTRVDDGGATFNNREDTIKGCSMICNAMAKWVLIVHAGRGDKKSKTKVMFISSTNKIKEWRQQKRLECGINTAEMAGSGVAKKKTVQTDIAKTCNSAPENRNMILDNDGCISFTQNLHVLVQTLILC